MGSVRGRACDGMVLMSPSASKIHHFVMGSGCACLARHGSARETDPLRGPACDANPLEMGSAHALPAYPSGAREADTVRGPACDGMLSPLVSPPLPAPPPSTSLPSAPKIHHFVMDTYCVRLRALPRTQAQKKGKKRGKQKSGAARQYDSKKRQDQSTNSDSREG